MATINRFVNLASTPGGDGTTNATSGANRAYASLSEWETAEQTDLVAAGNIHRVELSGDGVDTVQVGVFGWTTGAANYIEITVAAGSRHNGTSRTVSGVGYQLSGTSPGGADAMFQPAEDYIRCNFLDVRNTNPRAMRFNIGLTAGDNELLFESCIFSSSAATANTTTVDGRVVPGSSINAIFRNCITVGATRSIDTRYCASAEISHCTFWRTGDQIGLVCEAEATIKDCYSGKASGTQQDYWTGGVAPSGSNNASSDGTATTDFTSSIVSKAGSAQFVSVAVGTEDLRLKSVSDLEGAGTPLVAVPLDFIGTARDGTSPDIGASEFALASTFTDDFDRANENLTASANWTLVGGVASGVQVRTNQLASITTSNPGTAAQCPDQGVGDKYVEASFVAGELSFICHRLTDQINWIGARYRTGTGQWEIWKLAAGVWTFIGSYTASLVSGDIGRFEMAGDVFKLFVNGTLRITSGTETFNSAETRQGVYGVLTPVDPWIDDFGAGIIGAPLTERYRWPFARKSAFVSGNDGKAFTYDNTTGLMIPAATLTGDHGALTGLADDDHMQYHNDARGDARYTQRANNLLDLASSASSRLNLDVYSKGEADTLLAAKQAAASNLTDVAVVAPTDGQLLVGDGIGFVGESGNTARTSLGLGTGDTPAFTAIDVSAGDATFLFIDGNPSGVPATPVVGQLYYVKAQASFILRTA